jgi:cytidylate kinase
MIVAVDGPAASGKGTLARRLAARYGLAHLDTGSIYRAAAMHAIEADGDPADPAVAEAAARRVVPADLSDERLRGEMVGQAASVVAAIPAVRAVLLGFQRDFARNPPGGARGAVLDGRDIGTVVCPDAEIKLFITADIAARAQRRWRELRESGLPAIYDRVLQDLEQRDARDKQRRTAPLVAASDAFVLDTTELDADAAFAAAVRHVETTLARKRA